MATQSTNDFKRAFLIAKSQTGTINDINVIGLAGTHSWINDMSFSLTGPNGAVCTLFDQICDNEDDFNVNFDDQAIPGALPCPPVG